MAKSLSSLQSTQKLNTNPPICVFYGVDGVGKTRLASEFPDPVYLPTRGERPPKGVDMPSPGTIESLEEMLDIFGELLTMEHDRKTVIIDSLDGLEPLVWKTTCSRLGVRSIEEPGYGKGYIEADTEWREYLGGVEALADNGVAVVQLAHPEITRFDSPTSDPYSRYSLKLNKRAAALVRESADVVGFLNYRVTLKKADVGFKKTVTHGESGGDRQINVEERAGFVAKNRYDMPATLQFNLGKGYETLAQYFPAPSGTIH
jgi:hypothetical protein